MMVLGFADYRAGAGAGRLATRLGIAHAKVSIHRFSDGKSRVALPPTLPERVIFCQSLNNPNEKFLLMILCSQARLMADASPRPRLAVSGKKASGSTAMRSQSGGSAIQSLSVSGAP